jgi:hypothetical protein
MKKETWGMVALGLTAVTVWGANPPGLPPVETQQITARGPHSQTVRNLVPYQDTKGNWQTRTNTFEQVESGLNYFSEKGVWEPASVEITGTQDGATAWQGQHKVSFADNLNVADAIQQRLPDGQLLTSHAYGLGYYDTATGQSVLIAAVQDCGAWLYPPNQVLYTNVFNGVLADVRYTYTKACFEQDVILRASPPPPEKYGLSSATSRLEVWTEFVQPPEPKLSTSVLNAATAQKASDQLVDQSLDFGSVRMGTGKTFVIGEEDESLALVAKQWVSAGDRRFLVEAVELSAVAESLQTLPETPEPKGGASLRKPSASRLQALLEQPVKGSRKNRGQAQAIRRMPADQLVAFNQQRGLVLDYTTINSTFTNYTFKGDTTYYVSGLVTLNGTNTVFEGGTVLKYANTNTAKVVVNTPVTWGGAIYRPVVLTARDDTSVGDVIGTNTLSGYYADTALDLEAGTANTTYTLGNLRIANAKTALVLNQKSGHVLSHVQLVNCQNGINPTSTDFSLRNALFNNVLTNFNGSSSTGRVEHLTVDGANWFNYNGTFGSGNLLVTNSLLVAVTNYGGYAATAVSTASTPTGVFQTVKGGSHYLASSSAYRNAGTPAINAALALDLAKLTTYPPVELTGGFTTDTVLAPQAQRDTDTPDLGYHFAPLDYLWGNLAVSSGKTLTLTNGVAVGLYGTAGITVNGSVVSQGLPNALNRLTLLSTVQENLSGIITNTGSFTLFGVSPVVSLRFTDVSFMAAATGGRTLQPSLFNTTFTIRDSQLRGVYSYVYNDVDSGYVSTQIVLRNSLVERCNIDWRQGYSSSYYLSLTIQNTLFSRCTLSLTRGTTYYGNWTVTDNLFDGTTTSIAYFTSYNVIDVLGYNAFINSNNPFGATGDKTGLLRDFVSGPLGDYYYPTNSVTNSLSTLLNADTNRTPASLGLYHYTTRADQQKEAGGVLDIGYHYISTYAYSGSGGYTGTQGGNGWSYARSTAAQGTTWTSLPTYGNPPGWTNVWYDPALTGNDFYTWIWNNGQHPGYNYDSVRLFTVPKAGLLNVWSQAINYAACGGDGTQVRVLRNGVSLAPWVSVPPVTTTWVAVNVGSPVAVGDQLAFQLNMVAANGCDATTWDPLITLDQPVDTDGDGVPDWLEDANGNGVFDLSEGVWNDPADLGFQVRITEPKAEANVP